MRDELTAALAQSGDRPLIARVSLTGATACHAGLAADPEAIEAECRAAAAAVGDSLYIEKLQLRTRAPADPLVGDDALAALRQTFLQVLDDPDVTKRLLDDFNRMNSLIPATGQRTRPPLSEPDIRALSQDAWAIVERALRQERAP
jgi:hypothetical protein